MPTIVGGGGKTDIVSNPDRELGKVNSIPVIDLSDGNFYITRGSPVLDYELPYVEGIYKDISYILPSDFTLWSVGGGDSVIAYKISKVALANDSYKCFARDLDLQDDTVLSTGDTSYTTLMELDFGQDYNIKYVAYKFGVNSNDTNRTAYARIVLESSGGSTTVVDSVSAKSTESVREGYKKDYNVTARYFKVQGRIDVSGYTCSVHVYKFIIVGDVL